MYIVYIIIYNIAYIYIYVDPTALFGRGAPEIPRKSQSNPAEGRGFTQPKYENAHKLAPSSPIELKLRRIIIAKYDA